MPKRTLSNSNKTMSLKTKSVVIEQYKKALPGPLKTHYGLKTFYTKKEIDSSITRTYCSFDYVCYAYAMFARQEEFDRIHALTNENCDYLSMREEIANQLFEGNNNFDAMSDLAKNLDTPNSEFDSCAGSNLDFSIDSGGIDMGDSGE